MKNIKLSYNMCCFLIIIIYTFCLYEISNMKNKTNVIKRDISKWYSNNFSSMLCKTELLVCVCLCLLVPIIYVILIIN